MSKKPRVFSREFKLMVVRRMLAGENVTALAREVKVLRKDLYYWRDRFRSGGAEALRRSGRPPKSDPLASVDKPARISKVGNAHIRRALYMPALVAVQHNPHVRAFFEKLVARGKTPLQAYVAVMRKLLHAIYGMLTTRTTFVATKFHAAA